MLLSQNEGGGESTMTFDEIFELAQRSPKKAQQYLQAQMKKEGLTIKVKIKNIKRVVRK